MSSSSQHNVGRRITLKYNQPNPLFEKWLEEWKNEAGARGSQMEHCFAKALRSLRKYPLPLHSGQECGVLQNFGNRLCVMLDRKLVEYRKQNPESSTNNVMENKLMTSSQSQSGSNNTKDSTDDNQRNKNARKLLKEKKSQVSQNSELKRKNSGDYVPAYRSGSYGILLGLLTCCQEEGYSGFVSKADLIKVAQSFCDTSFSKVEHGSLYNAWSSMSTLIKKGFVSTSGRGKYSLTTVGECLALKLKNITQEKDNDSVKNDAEDDIEVVENLVSTCSTDTIPDVIYKQGKSLHLQEKRKLEEEINSVILQPGSFEVLLLVDNHETSGVSGGSSRNDTLLNDLQKQNINAEVCNLKVGDFAWICRDKTSGQELILPYIVERKRIDDFAHSIMDGRFHEQKFRLKRCGIPHRIYLVEKHGKESHTALPVSSLNQAAANTHIIDGFVIKYTTGNKESALYLAYFTQFLSNLFKPKTLVMCNKDDLPQFSVDDEIISLMSFKEFNSSSKKTKKLCVQDMFIKQLLQLNGLSVDKALAIVDRLPTPRAMYNALKMNPDKKLIADIPYGTTKRRIGPVLGKVVTELYTNTYLR